MCSLLLVNALCLLFLSNFVLNANIKDKTNYSIRMWQVILLDVLYVFFPLCYKLYFRSNCKCCMSCEIFVSVSPWDALFFIALFPFLYFWESRSFWFGCFFRFFHSWVCFLELFLSFLVSLKVCFWLKRKKKRMHTHNILYFNQSILVVLLFHTFSSGFLVNDNIVISVPRRARIPIFKVIILTPTWTSKIDYKMQMNI